MAATLNVLGKFPKKPVAVKRYRAEFEEWLDTGELVQGCQFTVETHSGNDAVPSLEVDNSTIVGGTSVVFFVSGGIDGVTYKVTLTVTTAAGQIEAFVVFFAVRE